MAPKTDIQATADILQRVPCLEALNDEARIELVEQSTVRSYGTGDAILNELETGDDVVVLLSGRAEVSVGAFTGTRPTVVNTIEPGDAVGEMATFTGELRSATVTATEPTRTLWISNDVFERLIQRHPEVARYFADTLAERLRTTERTLGRALHPDAAVEQQEEVLRQTGNNGSSQGPLKNIIIAIYRELVLSRKRDVAFVMFLSFLLALIGVRLTGWVLRSQHLPLAPLLDTTRILGVVLLCVSGFGALVNFAPRVRQTMAGLFGVGLAFLFEQPSVWLTFDIFYVDVFTRDANLTFDIETLYERSDGTYYLIIAAALLLQAVYLRHFYFRVAMVVGARIARFFRGSPASASAESES